VFAVAANVVPGVMRELVDLCLTGRFDKAARSITPITSCSRPCGWRPIHGRQGRLALMGLPAARCACP